MRGTLIWTALMLTACQAGKDEVADDSEVNTTDDSNGTDDSSADDSATDDSGTDDSGEAQTVSMNMALLDIFDGSARTGAIAQVDGQSYTPDAEGRVRFELPAGVGRSMSVTEDGYLDSYQSWVVEDTGFRGSHYMLSRATAAQIAGLLGAAIDPARAQVNVLLADTRTDPYELVPNATIDLDVAYDVALVSDPNSPYQVSVGRTTYEEVRSSVVFVNVAPGAFHVSVTPPEGITTCEWGLGGTALEDWAPEAKADSLNIVWVFCQ